MNEAAPPPGYPGRLLQSFGAVRATALAVRLRANAQEAVVSLRSVLARSALALVGIVVGIGAVIALVSTGQTVKEESLKQFRELGTDIVTVRRQFTRIRGRALDLALSDVQRLAPAVPAIESAAASVDANSPIRYRGQILAEGAVFGVTGAFFDLSKLPLAEGRLISDLDRHRFYCVAGAGVARGIRDAGSTSVLGEHVRVFGRLCTVVGVLQSVPPLAVGRQLAPDQTVFMPIAAVMRAAGARIREAVARMNEGVTPETARLEVERYFQRIRPELPVTANTASQLIARMRSQGQLFALLLGVIAAISLIVGGVGVMNVMLMSVRERRAEIGLRRAIGARRGDVQQQFVVESAALCLAGGALGVALGIAVAWGICRFAGWPFSVSTTAVVAGVSVATAIGVFFGLYPAYRASRLDPIEALRS
ncbi:MAG: ABC transporter permease [Gammaproteobacteria bacterium]|nr:ABC transporter permease [Gammaproteobacteria bacterium]